MAYFLNVLLILGIIRGLAARRKSHRVSFADEPIIYTFGGSTPVHSEVTPPRSTQPEPSVPPIPAKNIEVSIEQLLTKPAGISIKTETDVDLDCSQPVNQV